MDKRRLGLLTACSAALALGLAPPPAHAGTYTVANCASDPNWIKALSSTQELVVCVAVHQAQVQDRRAALEDLVRALPV